MAYINGWSCIAFKSPTRLEGMETTISTLMPISLNGLRPALRGWKLELRRALISDAFGLRPALRGWKLRNDLHPNFGKLASPTRLEGMETNIAPR